MTGGWPSSSTLVFGKFLVPPLSPLCSSIQYNSHIADECVSSRFIASNLAHGSKVSFECRIVEIGVETAYPCFN
jgi:hypothetical protein